MADPPTSGPQQIFSVECYLEERVNSRVHLRQNYTNVLACQSELELHGRDSLQTAGEYITRRGGGSSNCFNLLTRNILTQSFHENLNNWQLFQKLI